MDVMPCRSRNRILFLKGVEVDEAIASKLMDNLLQILDWVTAYVRQKTDFRCLADISSRSLHLILPKLSPQFTYRFRKSQRRNTLQRAHCNPKFADASN